MMNANDFSAKQILILVTAEKQKISIRNDNVIITDADGNIIHQSTCYRLFAVFIVGHISITSVFIQRARKFDFSIVFMTDSFRMYQVISGGSEANVLLRQKQYSYKDVAAARSLIANKIDNQIDTLYTIRSKTPGVWEAIRRMREYSAKLSETDTISGIMGLEGSASRMYFGTWFDNVDWKGRKPRIKPDMINAVLDIGYTILFGYVEAVACTFGFDRYCGILHRQFYMRKSLICDLVEPFRVIIDKQVKASINLNQFRDEDFVTENNRWCLQYKYSKQYSSIFIKAILKHKDSIFLYIRDFYRAMMKEELNSNMPVWRMKSDDTDQL